MQMIQAYLKEKETSNWPKSLKFVQWNKNSTINRNINSSPYKIVFGRPPALGLDKSFPLDILKRLPSTSEDISQLYDNDISQEDGIVCIYFSLRKKVDHPHHPD